MRTLYWSTGIKSLHGSTAGLIQIASLFTLGFIRAVTPLRSMAAAALLSALTLFRAFTLFSTLALISALTFVGALTSISALGIGRLGRANACRITALSAIVIRSRGDVKQLVLNGVFGRAASVRRAASRMGGRR